MERFLEDVFPRPQFCSHLRACRQPMTCGSTSLVSCHFARRWYKKSAPRLILGDQDVRRSKHILSREKHGAPLSAVNVCIRHLPCFHLYETRARPCRTQ
jgi:hypothetical protein